MACSWWWTVFTCKHDKTAWRVNTLESELQQKQTYAYTCKASFCATRTAPKLNRLQRKRTLQTGELNTKCLTGGGGAAGAKKHTQKSKQCRQDAKRQHTITELHKHVEQTKQMKWQESWMNVSNTLQLRGHDVCGSPKRTTGSCKTQKKPYVRYGAGLAKDDRTMSSPATKHNVVMYSLAQDLDYIRILHWTCPKEERRNWWAKPAIYSGVNGSCQSRSIYSLSQGKWEQDTEIKKHSERVAAIEQRGWTNGGVWIHTAIAVKEWRVCDVMREHGILLWQSWILKVLQSLG